MSTDTATHDDTGHADHHADTEHEHGLTDLGYVKVAIALAIITAIEVALSYMVDDLGALFLPLLLALMVVKFFSVVLFFMHLKFDNRLFGVLFYLGLGLAIGVFMVTLLTFKFFNS